jgi:ABC-2 type transport system permease protein/oleandomycin transport system permease protein
MTATTISARKTVTSTRPVGGSIISDTLVITRRNLTRVVRTPQLVFFQTAQPVMFVLLFRYVFGGAIAPRGFEGRYVDFLIPGILVQTCLFSGAGTAFGLAEDISKGIIDRFRSLPMARSAVLAGRVLSDMVRTLFTTLLMVGVGMLVGFRFHNGFIHGVFAIALVMLFAFAFSWFFALIGLVVKNIESVEIASFTPIFPLTFAASTFVPVQGMPGWLQAFAKAQPISQVVNATRTLTQGVRPPTTQAAGRPVLYSLLWIVAITAVFAGLAIRRYQKVE